MSHNYAKLEIGEKVLILNSLGFRGNPGILLERNFKDVRHGCIVKDLKDNSIKRLSRSDIKKYGERKCHKSSG
jgi:hypothetical protein